MRFAVYLPLIAPLLAAIAAPRLAERLPPRIATWLLTGSALALAAASSAVLGLLALAAAVRIPLVDVVAGLSLNVMSAHDPASLPLGAAAGALLVAAAAAVLRAGWRRADALIAAHRQAHRLPGARDGGRVIVVTDDAADAYSVPGWPGRIVVTSGMMRALSATERRVLLAHEQAHSSGRHYLFTAAVRLASAANPLLRPLSAAVGYSVERWADEQAADATGDRPLAARTIAKAALAASATPSGTPRSDSTAPCRRPVPAGALGVVTSQPGRRGAGVVPRRVAALLRPAPRLRLLPLAAVLTLVMISGLSALQAARGFHGLLEFAQTPTSSATASAATAP
ncbi:MAG TPA: M56 family metallopeptidase [Streptosporangiaceae bacterium]|nr:M56 family metallopeptidase [Streptosporangiaceae bacterium]